MDIPGYFLNGIGQNLRTKKTDSFEPSDTLPPCREWSENVAGCVAVISAESYDTPRCIKSGHTAVCFVCLLCITISVTFPMPDGQMREETCGRSAWFSVHTNLNCLGRKSAPFSLTLHTCPRRSETLNYTLFGALWPNVADFSSESSVSHQNLLVLDVVEFFHGASWFDALT